MHFRSYILFSNVSRSTKVAASSCRCDLNCARPFVSAHSKNLFMVVQMNSKLFFLAYSVRLITLFSLMLLRHFMHSSMKLLLMVSLCWLSLDDKFV